MYYSRGYCMVCTTLDSLGAKSPDICENRTYKHTYIYAYMIRAHFLSIVGLRIRAFGAQPPSEQQQLLMNVNEQKQRRTGQKSGYMS